MTDKARKTNDFDVLIIGAGPAGLSAGIWCADLGLKAAIFEKEPEAGGQLLWIYNPITNYPGLYANNGRELRDRFLDTFNRFEVPLFLSAEVVAIDSENTSVTIAEGRVFTAKFIVFAAGVRRRKLNIPGEEEFKGKGILESGARDKLMVKDKTVAIIGGGDAALENALILSEYSSKIYLIHRGNKFRSREEFIRQVRKNSKIECLFSTAISQINGTNAVESIDMSDLRTDRKWVLDVNFVLIRVGVEPNTHLLEGASFLDEKGYSSLFHSYNHSPIFSVGDVANPIAKTIANSVGDGAAASKTIHNLLKGRKRLSSQ